jgi:cystathionine gamma-synthase
VPIASHTISPFAAEWSHGPIYSRFGTPTSARLEATLSAVLGSHATVYPSGLAAFHALLVRANPRRLVIAQSYHGVYATAGLFSRLTGMEIRRFETGGSGEEAIPELTSGDLLHLESPVNPTGTAVNLRRYIERAHAAGVEVSVDSTFAPPPLQDPFALGADWVLHSGSKYLGGHSDVLSGVLCTRSAARAEALREERTFMGCVLGGLEAWLSVRSLRTLQLRVTRQSKSAVEIVAFLAQRASQLGVVEVTHASLQNEEGTEEEEDSGWLRRQMPGGFGPVFALVLRSEDAARNLPSHLHLWVHATSLGGVESLVEWRYMSDSECDKRLLRFSVGVEDSKDLIEDLRKGLDKVKEL